MTTRPARRPPALVGLALSLAFASCARKEEPPATAVARETPAATLAPATTLPSPTPEPTPPPVWRAARWGMTKKELLAAFSGEAQRLAQPAAFTQPQEGASTAAGSSDLGIPELEIEGNKFRVLFGFESEALTRIHLAAAKPDEGTCGQLEQALTREHAAPLRRSRTGTSLRGEEIVWQRPDQTIVLSCAGIRNLGFHTVALDYLAPSTAVAER